MFSRFRSWVSRHRRKFIVTGAVVGGTIFLYKYAQRAIREWQERETRDLLERTRKMQHYESIERTCNQTALTLAPNLKDTIVKLLKTEELVEQLKLGVEDKLAIWEKLKILAFTKISVLVYASSLLMVTLRIQLNLIGGYMFRDTNETEETQISSSIQEKYLSLCEYFIEDGAKRLCELIQEKVTGIIQDRSLKEKLTVHDIEQIFWAVQSSVTNDERDPCKNLRFYLLPEVYRRDSDETHSNVFDAIITETNDLLECDEITSLTGSCISRGFSYVMDQVADFFHAQNGNNIVDVKPTPGTSKSAVGLEEKHFSNLTKVSIPMAKMIPIVNGLVQSHASKNDVPHTWMEQLILMDSLKTMGANIYETFSSSSKG